MALAFVATTLWIFMMAVARTIWDEGAWGMIFIIGLPIVISITLAG